MPLELIPGSPEAAAFDVVHGVYMAFGEGRPADIESVQMPEYSVWDGLTPGLRMSLDEVKQFHAQDQGHKVSRGALTWSLVPLKVDVLGDVAVVLSQLEISYEPPNALDARLRVSDVLRRVDGAWMMFHHHESVEPVSGL